MTANYITSPSHRMEAIFWSSPDVVTLGGDLAPVFESLCST
ncbi:MAG: hypothetical protein ACYTKD_15280 [Planctomycetota bacterium]